jgi:hypothetical protein
LFTLSVEIVSVILASNGVNNLWLYRIYMYAELIFPVLFFFNQFSKRSSKNLIVVVCVSAVIFTTLINVFDDWQTSASVQTFITFGSIAYIIISFFVEMFRTEKVFNPFKDVYFVVGGVLLLGYSSTLLYNVLYDYVITGYIGSEIHSVLDGVNMSLVVFYNVLYSYALWISKHRPT